MVNKEFQEEKKHGKGKYYFSEQLLTRRRKGTISWKKTFLEKDAHSKSKEGTSGKQNGNSRKKGHSGNKMLFFEKYPPLEWSFLDVSSKNEISKFFLGTLFSHGSDILAFKFPKISPASIDIFFSS